jgi:hypothetical protein
MDELDKKAESMLLTQREIDLKQNVKFIFWEKGSLNGSRGLKPHEYYKEIITQDTLC